jgi:hypothetical protein
LLSLCGAVSAHAQAVVNPAYLEFTASPDHHATGNDGQPLVLRYDFVLLAAGVNNPARIVSLGKPAPDSAGTIRIALAAILIPMPTGTASYEARVTAIGPRGSTTSAASNSFAFQGTCTYGVSPGSRAMPPAGGAATFTVAAPAGCAWSASEQSAWLTITSGSNGSGNGSVTVAVAANTGSQPRSATATIAGQTIAVSQTVGTAPNAPTGFRTVR